MGSWPSFSSASNISSRSCFSTFFFLRPFFRTLFFFSGSGSRSGSRRSSSQISYGLALGSSSAGPQIGSAGEFARLRLQVGYLLVELVNGGVHLLHRDVGSATSANGIHVAKAAGDSLHVLQLGERARSFIFLPPVG